jgi:DNA-binding HxlR family transcriptional regulator
LRKRLGAEEAIEVVADKWFVLIVAELRTGKKRYGELRKAIPGISPRMLTVTLRKMERDGLVERTVFPVVPPRTEYALTELGRTLLGPLRELCLWAERNYGEVRKHRERADRQPR